MISAERARELISYDPVAGTFTWKTKYGRRKKKGDISCGSITHGYLIINIDKRHYRAHRLAWLISYGKWPGPHLDHINQVKTDNRLANLRELSPAANVMNISKAQKNSGSRVLGVFPVESGRWISKIQYGKTRLHLGTFDTIEQASAAYLEAKLKAFPELTNLRRLGGQTT